MYKGGPRKFSKKWIASVTIRVILEVICGKRGSAGPSPEIKKQLDCKCCNQSYSGGLFVNKGGLRVHPRKFSKN